MNILEVGYFSEMYKKKKDQSVKVEHPFKFPKSFSFSTNCV